MMTRALHDGGRRAVLSTLVLAAVCHVPKARAQAPDDILNYTEFSAVFASAGQPTARQLEAVRDAGYERVVYIAFSNDRNALSNEDRLVRELGMDYVHIPVVWDSPTVADFDAFAAVMQADPGKKTLLHCQVNMRASAFAFLYRVVYDEVPVARAKADMNLVWEPNPTWRDLIFEVLGGRGIDPECDGCDWTD